MRTRTIFEAYTKACIDTLNAKEWRQRDTFERELLRRMDERDAMFISPDGRRRYKTPQPPAPKPQIITRF